MAKYVGYEFLRDKLGTYAAAPWRPAAIFPVTKITPLETVLQVPAAVAPQTEDPLEHLLFALKHEGLDMQASILALKRIDERSVGQAFLQAQSSAYVRKICYLWEIANERKLDALPAVQGGYVPLFEPDAYITREPAARAASNTRWRVDFNGLGSERYCPSVRRTPLLETLLQHKTLEAASDLINGLPKAVLDRAVRWAYLSETEGSYDIEREKPTADKAQAFASLLSKAHLVEPITEEYLVGLQQLAVTNSVEKAFEFRNRQNWLRGPLTGALGVTYLPPPPDVLEEVMENVMAMANGVTAIRHDPLGSKSPSIDPLVLGSIVSFGFVFAHPFSDGNGRLSRFLFHRVVCSSGQLSNGLVLPISVAMKRNEERYLAALQSFSRPAREAWDVTWIDGDRFDFKFNADPAIYRYWDATPAVTFGLEMAQEALLRDLHDESEFLQRYDRAIARANDAVDMNSNDLVSLVGWALEQGGKISKNRHRQMVGKGHPEQVLTRVQEAIASVYEDEQHEVRSLRMDELPSLQSRAGAAYTFWTIASAALDWAGDDPDEVDWQNVHAQVFEQSVLRNGQEPADVLAILCEHSPGAVAPATHLALEGIAKEYQRKAADLTKANVWSNEP